MTVEWIATPVIDTDEKISVAEREKVQAHMLHGEPEVC